MWNVTCRGRTWLKNWTVTRTVRFLWLLVTNLVFFCCQNIKLLLLVPHLLQSLLRAHKGEFQLFWMREAFALSIKSSMLSACFRWNSFESYSFLQASDIWCVWQILHLELSLLCQTCNTCLWWFFYCTLWFRELVGTYAYSMPEIESHNQM